MTRLTGISQSIAVYGGMFDPVHLGHTKIASHARDYLELDCLYMVPCHLPNHKVKGFSAATHRLAMLKLATSDLERIEVDDFELNRHQTSYSVDTLSDFRQRFKQASLIFILGVDSFSSLTEWHQWQRLFELCHFLVYSRPGFELDQKFKQAVGFNERRVTDKSLLQANSHGNILLLETFNMDVSSTEIRQLRRSGKSLHKLVDKRVQAYIEQHNLYRNKLDS